MNSKTELITATFEKVIFALFPNRCPYCKQIIPPYDYACDRCKKEIPVLGFFRGVKGEFQCSSPLMHCGTFRKALLGFKFKNKTQFAPDFAQLIYKQIQESYSDYIFDMITYIPMHKKDEQKRGYNQSQLLANELSKLMKIPCVNTLRKVKRTRPQHNLPAVQRRNNLNGAFRIIDKNIVKGKTILIIDDVITTGSTLFECSKTLKKGNTAQICCATLATAVDFRYQQS